MTITNDGAKRFSLLSDDGNSARSLLRADHPGPEEVTSEEWGTLSESERQAATAAFRIMSEENDNNSPDKSAVSWKRITVRECPCVSHFNFGEQFYCEAKRGYCAIPSAYYGDSADPVCLDIQNKEVFVRSVWPIILIWFALTGAFCVLTFSGRNAMDYALTSLFPKWNEMIFEAICYDPESNNDHDNRPGLLRKLFYVRRNQFQNRYRGIVNRAQIREEGGNPDDTEGMPYEIRTRRFHKTENAIHAEPDSIVHSCDTLQDEEESEASCAICFLPLEEGERVGVIDCGHVFHVDCLKVGDRTLFRFDFRKVPTPLTSSLFSGLGLSSECMPVVHARGCSQTKGND